MVFYLQFCLHLKVRWRTMCSPFKSTHYYQLTNHMIAFIVHTVFFFPATIQIGHRRFFSTNT